MEDPQDKNRTTIMFILADGPATGSLDDLMDAIVKARSQHYSAAYLLASPTRAEEAVEAVRLTGRKGFTLVQAIEYTGEMGSESGLSDELLMTMGVLAESSLDTYTAVLATGLGTPTLIPRTTLEKWVEVPGTSTHF